MHRIAPGAKSPISLRFRRRDYAGARRRAIRRAAGQGRVHAQLSRLAAPGNGTARPGA